VHDVRGGRLIREIAQKGRIGSDAAYPGTEPLGDSFKKLRYSMTPSELKRYQWLGKEAAQAVEDVCREVQPGMNEFEMEAMTSASLPFARIVSDGAADRGR